MIVDYGFYEDTYGGTVVSDNLFNRYYTKAKKYLDRVTYGRIVSVNIDDAEVWGIKFNEQGETADFLEFADNELESIKYGLCALIDAMSNVDNATDQSLKGGADDRNIRSRSSGGESVTYDSAKSIYVSAMADKKVEAMLYRSALMDYINPSEFRINPFYAGIR